MRGVGWETRERGVEHRDEQGNGERWRRRRKEEGGGGEQEEYWEGGAGRL